MIVILIIVAVALAVASYEYSTTVSASVVNLSFAQIHSSAQIESSSLGHIVQERLSGISQNLAILSNSHAVKTRNTTDATPLFTAAQNTTGFLTSGYFWLDQNGRLVLFTNGTNTRVDPPGAGIDLSQRSYFLAPKDNGTTFFSNATASITNTSVDYIFISDPVYKIQSINGIQSKLFAGVVVALIDLRTLGDSLRSDLSSNLQSAVGLLDFKGVILYSGNQSNIGESVFSSTIQNSIPASLKQEFDALLNQSLQGNAGLQDISYQGVTGTIAYEPIFVNATTSSGSLVPVQFGVLYVTAVDTLGTGANALIGQDRFVSLVIILGIAAVFGGFILTSLRWNRQLDEAVRQKTSDLLIANQELDTKSKAERDLMNITAHEIRTPTQSILANTEILRKTIRPALGLPSRELSTVEESLDSLAIELAPEEMVELVDSSYRNAQRLQRLTQNILEVARIDNKTSHLETEKFDLIELVRQSVRDQQGPLNQNSGSRKNLTEIIFEPKQMSLIVNADRTKISEVMTNLLDNAIRFSNENGGNVEITTGKVDGFAQVKVRDEGGGIDQEILPKLFTKFATKTGTGLGLYISKAFVEAHGGEIKAENMSCAPDGKKPGAIFTFTLPIDNKSISK